MEFMSALSETEESVVQHNLGPSFDDLRKKHQSRGYYRIITSAFSQRTKSGYVVNRGVSQVLSRLKNLILNQEWIEIL